MPKTGALDHSATLPQRLVLSTPFRACHSQRRSPPPRNVTCMSYFHHLAIVSSPHRLDIGVVASASPSQHSATCASSIIHSFVDGQTTAPLHCDTPFLQPLRAFGALGALGALDLSIHSTNTDGRKSTATEMRKSTRIQARTHMLSGPALIARGVEKRAQPGFEPKARITPLDH